MKITLEEAKKRMELYGGSLYLRDTGITSLPEGLTVGGGLDLRDTGITSLPEGLTVGGGLDLSGTGIEKSAARRVRRLKNGDYSDGKYLFCDGILTHIEKNGRLAIIRFM